MSLDFPGAESSTQLVFTLSCSLLLTRICEIASPFIQSPFASPHSASPSSSPVIVVVVDPDGLEGSFFTSTNEGDVESKGNSATSTISLDWEEIWNGECEWAVGWV